MVGIVCVAVSLCVRVMLNVCVMCLRVIVWCCMVCFVCGSLRDVSRCVFLCLFVLV